MMFPRAEFRRAQYRAECFNAVGANDVNDMFTLFFTSSYS